MAETNPLLDQAILQEAYGTYEPLVPGSGLPNVPFRKPSLPLPTVDGEPTPSSLSALRNSIISIPSKEGMITGGGIPRSLAEVTSNRYESFVPGDYNNEDAYARGQGWPAKMVNSVGKGLLLTGTTLLQTTLGTLNGLVRMAETGRAASFYDNEMNRILDEINKAAEDVLPNYYTDVEKNARWYSPSKLFTANFFWDGIVKNLGFAAGAAISGGIFATGLRALPLTARLFSVGKAAETLAATEEALLAANKVAKTYGKIKGLSDKFLASYSFLNPTGRALVATLATTGEAGFEAYHNLNDFRNDKIEEWKAAHGGREPVGEDLDVINAQADDIGNSSFLLNTGLLSVTNFIQFPTILGSSYRAEKGIINALRKDISPTIRDVAGNLVRVEAKTRAGKLLSALNVIRPYTFSTSEAFEEGAQYAISIGTQDYYNKKYNEGAADFLESIAHGIGETFGTDEGMENILIGGLSGAIMLARGKFKEDAQRKRNTADAIQRINKYKLSDFTKETIDAVNRGTTIQEEREVLLRQGDILEVKEKERDYIINYLTPRIKYGRYDLIEADIAEYEQLASTEPGFSQLQAEGKALQTDTRAAYLQRLSNLKETAGNMRSLYQSLQLRYGGFVDENNTPVYSQEVMNKMIYSATKVADYDTRIPQLSATLLEAGVDVDTTIAGVLKEDPEPFNLAVAEIQKLDVTSDVKDSLIEALTDISEISLRRQKFLKEYDEIKNSPKTFKTPEVADIPEGQRVVVKTKDGEEDVIVGEEYYLGRVVEYDESGKEVYRFPKLTILGENPDGTIKIKDSSGNIRDVSKAVLADYKLGRVRDVEKNSNASFYLRNINKPVYWNTGKKKRGKIIGRLDYDSKADKLYFVYKQNNKIKRILVGIDQFEPTKDYVEGLFTFGQPLTAVDLKNIKDRKDSGKTKEDQRDRRGERLAILDDLYTEISESHTKTQKLITQKKEELTILDKNLKELKEKIESSPLTPKKANLKATIKRAIQASLKLTRMRNDLSQEIQKLEAERDELELNASYVADLSQNIDELPTDSKEFLEELKDQRDLLNDAVLNTGIEINAISKLVDDVEATIEKAIDFLNSIIKEFTRQFPKAPLAIGQELVDFLQNNPNFLKIKSNYRSELKDLENIVAEVEDMEISPNQEKLSELRTYLSDLQKSLESTEKELKAKSLIVSRFEEIAEKHRKEEEEKKQLSDNEQLKRDLLGTAYTGTATEPSIKPYEPESKKTDIQVVRSTISATTSTTPHHVRANLFGATLLTLPNREDIRGALVTSATEDQLGLAGLTQFLKDQSDLSATEKAKIDPAQTIVMVMVDAESLKPVGIDGKILESPSVDTAIFQVRPTSDLKWSEQYGGESMFREDTPQETVDYYKERHKKETEEILTSKEPIIHQIEPSFGIFDYIKYKDDKGKEHRDYKAITPVEQTGLIQSSDLQTKKLVEVSTKDGSIIVGEKTFRAPLGRTFLHAMGNIVPLMNRNLTNNEAATIYEAIYQLAIDVFENNDVKSEKAKRLYNWLKTVIYWGKPQNATGYSSVFFSKDLSTLEMGRDVESMPFTPSSIRDNKDRIIRILSNMYNNVNNTWLTKEELWNSPYEEIVEITPKGEIITRSWVNYQTYLLSDKLVLTQKDHPDNKKSRKPEDIPLFTNIKPIKEGLDISTIRRLEAGEDVPLENETNRKGIYFTIVEDVDDWAAPKKAAIITPAAEKKTYSLNSSDTYISPAGKKIKFTVGATLDSLKVLQGEDLKEVLAALTAQVGEEKAKENIKNTIKAAISPQIDDIEIEFKIEDEPTIAKPSILKLPPNKVLQKKIQDSETSYTIPDDDLRAKLKEETSKFLPENWKEVEQWLKTNFPLVPVYRVKNILQATNGLQAWGMLKNGSIYVYESAEVGTIYHEVFEAIWKTFSTPSEQAAVTSEFKQREGSFIDRPTGKSIKYADASPQEIKEQLAEEFRDFVINKKVPVKPKSGKPFIVKLFNDIYNFIKAFFTGDKATSNAHALFQKIGGGYYKDFTPTSQLSFARKGIMDVEEVIVSSESEFRIKNIPTDIVSDIIQQMTWKTFKILTGEEENLFNIQNKNKTELYKELKEDLLSLISSTWNTINKMVEDKEMSIEEGNRRVDNLNLLWERIDSEWNEIKLKHQEHLAQYSLEFDENDEIQRKDEDKIKESNYVDATKVDAFRKANGAIKLLLATTPIIDPSSGKRALSSINGMILLPSTEAYIAIKNRVHDARNIDEMMEKLKEIGEEDSTYKSVYQRLTGNLAISDIKKKYQAQLLTAFWKTFKQQNADVKVVYVLENGDIEVGDSNLSTAARQINSEYLNNIIRKFKRSNPYFEYSEKNKAYIHKKDNRGKAAISLADVSSISSQVKFLKELGILFKVDEYRRLSKEKKKVFTDSVKGIKLSLQERPSIKTISSKTLNISNRLISLSLIRASLDNPEFSSTFFNVAGERVQTYIGINSISNLYDYLSKVDNIRELENTPYSYLLTDVFSKNSVILKKMFHPDTGDRIEGTDHLMKSGWADGTIDIVRGKNKQSSKQTYKERLLQELTLNSKGYYYPLVPGDASMEHAEYMGTHVSSQSLTSGYDRVQEIFEGYFIDELNLSRDKNREIADVEGRKSSDLRWFKDILGKEVHDKIIRSKKDPQVVYNDNKAAIQTAVERFFEAQIKNNQALLNEYNIEREESTVRMHTVNYVISNIEFHKLVFSDPYQYSDELKRVKLALSPSQAIINNSSEMNSLFNNVWNEDYEAEDIGWTPFTQDYFKTVMLSDVESTSDLKDYGIFKETDGGGIISMRANRWLRIKAGNWNDNNEKQYKYDVVYEKKDKNIALTAKEEKIWKKGNPQVRDTYTPLKPKVFGNASNNQLFNNIIADKFSLYVSSYRIMHQINPTSNALKLYNKMQKEDRDYAVFKSGRKVGGVNPHSVYNAVDGSFNETPFPPSTNIPHSILTIQTDIPSKEDWRVARGTQITKLSTLDLLEAGVLIDFNIGEDYRKRYIDWFKLTEGERVSASPLYKEIKNNQDILEASIEHGIDSLMKRMGISLVDENYEISDIKKTIATLKKELLKREVNDNITDALSGFERGHTILEATPLYFQIRNILYSIADKEVISPNISGGERVQITSSFLESTRHVKGNVYESDVLKFYEKTDEGVQLAEIMVGRWWFDNPITDKMTDDELLAYLNKKENKHILEGVGFRIPTQKLNSIEVFKIAKLLPKEFGDSVVVPSALVRKVGSDFDIDKLNIYLKNLYITKDGTIKSVQYKGSKQATKDFYSDLYDELHATKKGTIGEQFEDVLKSIITEEENEDFIASKEVFVDRMYKRALENAYIESLQKILSHPLNFDQLIKPNDASPLKDLATKITKQKGIDEFNYTSVGNMLNWHFMSRLRQAFVSGKAAIGIAAVNQTNHSLNQRQPFIIDPKQFSKIDPKDLYWLSGGTNNIADINIKFKEYNTVVVDNKVVPTLSMIKNKAGEFISDIIGMFIDGYVDISKGPWIMELGAAPNVAPTWLLLLKMGISKEDVAYFMNQPIIRDYLKSIENDGYSWLYIKDNLEEILDNYKTNKAELAKIKQIPSAKKLFEYVGKDKFTAQENAEQQFMLKEFLKYAKMAQHLFYVTQGTNFDTANFSDPYLVFRKRKLLEKARNTIFSNVDDILKNSYIGKLKDNIYNIRDAYSTILASDKYNTRDVLEDVLDPYIDENERDFLPIARKAVNNLFDWAVQTDNSFNKYIQNILLSENNTAEEIQDFVNTVRQDDTHPLYNNQAIKLLTFHSSDRENSPNNLKIKNKGNKVYDQNQLIYAFREIKEYLNGGNKQLYDKLVLLSVLQSGLSNSPISFTQFLPYEDFSKIYSSTISNLETLENLPDFHKLNVFQRNNWNDGDIVPHRKARWKEGYYGWEYNKNMDFNKIPALKRAIDGKIIPPLLKLDDRSKEAGDDVILYSWEEGTKEEKQRMRKEGDFSYIKKSLFQKVYKGSDPLFNTYTIKDSKTGEDVKIIEYIYKAINAWGDSHVSAGMYFSANEFYSTAQPSIINNGFLKVKEVVDKTIVDVFERKQLPTMEQQVEEGTDQIPPCA